MKVYDCFTFYNEFELLELRLKSLWDMVDYFVLVEADKTLNNAPKPFYFAERREEFKEFLPKIRHIPLKVNVDYKGVGDWQIEFGQRNAIMYGLTDAAPDDLIFISDLDEFPAPDILQRIEKKQAPVISQCPVPPPLPDGRIFIAPCQILIPAANLLDHTPIGTQQSLHCYYLDWASKGEWHGTVMVKRKNLTTPQHMRDFRVAVPYIPNGGWHFSYMGGVDRIIKKMTSVVEGHEWVLNSNNNLMDRDYIKECMKTGKELYGRKNIVEIPESQFYPYDISNITLPYLPEFLKKYPHFLRKYDFGEE